MKTYYVKISVRSHGYLYDGRFRASSRRVAVNRALADFEFKLRADGEWNRLKNLVWDIVVNDDLAYRPNVRVAPDKCPANCTIKGEHDHTLLADVFSVPGHLFRAVAR